MRRIRSLPDIGQELQRPVTVCLRVGGRRGVVACHRLQHVADPSFKTDELAGTSPDAVRKLAQAIRGRALRALDAAARLEAVADTEHREGSTE